MKRTFSKEEAQRIFADAAERQQAEARHTDEHLTLEELEDAAFAAGIDPAYVRSAAELLVRPGHPGTERRILGMPIEYRRSLVLPFALDDDAWSRIVAELRRIFKIRGIASDVGAVREWITDAREQRSPVRVTAEPEGNSTRLTIERNTVSRILGFAGGALSIVLTALILAGIALAGGETELWLPVLMMVTIGLLLGAGAFAGTRIASRRDAARFDEAVRGIRQIGDEHTSRKGHTSREGHVAGDTLRVKGSETPQEPVHDKPMLDVDDTDDVAPLRGVRRRYPRREQ